MQIGIVTLHASDNCGSLLQAYALQYTLETKYHHTVKIIHFSSYKGRKMYRIIHPSYIKSPLKFLHTLIEYAQLKKEKEDYKLFRKNFLHLTEQNYRSYCSLETAENGFDVIVTGSDQVWNTRMYDFDNAFFLAWVKRARKIAYAASLGDHKGDTKFIEDIKAHKREIESFQLISTREESSRLKLSAIFEKKIYLCVDPTLLVPSSHWREIAGDRLIKENYIFYYSYNYADDSINELVRYISEYYKLPVVVINRAKWLDGRDKEFGFHIFNDSGPIVFLNLTEYASYTLVESFHGIIFSFLMRKEFWFLKKNSYDELDDRIESILNILDCSKRIINPSTKNILSQDDLKINYDINFSKLEHMKKDSFDFLDGI